MQNSICWLPAIYFLFFCYKFAPLCILVKKFHLCMHMSSCIMLVYNTIKI
uniref:Uncharacterized protein n=1 Tax=Setaria italica TaxID=4555 RepID=K3Z1M2_SETIT